MIEPEVANQLLEPGSGVPDVKKILERVRAGQKPRATMRRRARSDKADFIAAARRAAQLAAEEADTLTPRQERCCCRRPIGGAFARHRRPILMAVGAVLLAIMSYPLVNTLIRGDRAPVEAPVAAIEQPVTSATPDAANIAMAPAGRRQRCRAAEHAAAAAGRKHEPGIRAAAAAEPQATAPETATPEPQCRETKLPEAEQAQPETATAASQMLVPRRR